MKLAEDLSSWLPPLLHARIKAAMERNSKLPAEQTHTGPAAEPVAPTLSNGAYVDPPTGVSLPRSFIYAKSNSPRLAAQRKLIEGIQNSPRIVAQRRQIQRNFSATAQLMGGPTEEELLKGNYQTVQRKGAEEEKLLQGKFAPVQFLQINAGEHPQILNGIDTAQYDAAVQEVDHMVTAHRKAGLTALRAILEIRGAGDANAKRLMQYVEKKLQHWKVSEDKAPMGWWERRGAVKAAMEGQPGANAQIQQGLNMWVVGDPQRGINWNMIGQHLRGRLTDDDYKNIGIMTALISGAPGLAADAVLQQNGRDQLNAVRDDIRAALAALPDFQGRSYRIAGIASRAVYASTIAEHDLIKDTTFWSTAAVRGAEGAGAGWGQEGTDDKPKAYYIIDGIAGKYIAKYSKVEGEQEVLFPDNSVFQVTRIVQATAASNTFFVYIQQIAAAPPGAPIKNPFNGTTY